MTKPPQASDRFLYFVVLWCVCSFKVLLWGIGEAGLRVDDLLMLVAFVLFLLRGDIVRIPRSRAFRAYLIFVCINFCSAAWNAWMGRVDYLYSTLFAVRLLQYMVFYYLGYALRESGIRVWRGLKFYFYALCIVVPLQAIDVIPIASRFNSLRASGNTNGPYELAAVSAFFLCYFGYRERKKVSAGLAFILLLLTASRITLAGTIIGFVMRSVSRSKSKLRAATVVALVVLVLSGGVAWNSSIPNVGENPESLANRLQSASTLVSFNEAHDLYAAVPTFRTAQDYFQTAFVVAIQFGISSGQDVSGMIRAFRWATLLKSALAQFDSILIGLGPSFGSAAVDGYYVRVFIETGIIGLMSFFVFLRAMAKQQGEASGAFWEFVIILIVTSCFIDIFTSYKTMILLWLWHGMNEYAGTDGDQVDSRPSVSIDN
jgi:hypothetical protein